MSRSMQVSASFGAGPLSGSDWAQLNNTWGTYQIFASGHASSDGTHPVTDSAATGPGAARWIGAGSYTDDQYAEFTINGLSFLSASFNAGAIVRASADQNSNRDWIGVDVCADSSGPFTTTIYRMDNGAYTQLYQATYGWANGDKVGIEVSGQAPNIQIAICQNQVAIGGAWTLTGQSGQNSGLPGLTGSGGDNVYASTYEFGNIVSGGGGTPGNRGILARIIRSIAG